MIRRHLSDNNRPNVPRVCKFAAIQEEEEEEEEESPPHGLCITLVIPWKKREWRISLPLALRPEQQHMQCCDFHIVCCVLRMLCTYTRVRTIDVIRLATFFSLTKPWRNFISFSLCRAVVVRSLWRFSRARPRNEKRSDP